MHLYYYPGACSMAVHIVLNEMGVAHTRESVDTAKGLTESGADYAAINPRGYVPALRLDSGEVITENAAILQYLGDQFPEHGLVPPAGTMARVRLQEVLSFLSSELHKAFNPFFSDREMTEAERADAKRLLALRLGDYEAMLANSGPYILGDQLSVADAYAYVILTWAQYTDVSLADWPRLVQYSERMAARAAVQQALGEEGLAA